MQKPYLTLLLAAVVLSCHEKSSSPSVVDYPTDWSMDVLKGNPTIVETDTYKVDSVSGKIDTIEKKTIVKYNDKGYVTDVINKNRKDSVLSTLTLTRDANGYFTKQVQKGGNGKMQNSYDFIMDSAHKYTLVKMYDSTDKLNTYYTGISQDKNLMLLGAKGYHKDSTLKMSFTNEWDSVYYIGGTSTDSVGKLTYKGKVKLNDKKLQVASDEMEVTKGVTKNTSVTYTYDAWDPKENWTQQTTLNQKGKPTSISKRIITYK